MGTGFIRHKIFYSSLKRVFTFYSFFVIFALKTITMKEELIHIENKFAIEARYKMSLIEQKVFYALVAKLNPYEENEFGEIGFTIAELKQILASEGKKYKSLYSRLDVLSRKMSKQTFQFVTEVKVEGKYLHGFVPFFQSVMPQCNEHGESAIFFRFNDLLKPFLLQLNEYVKMNQLCIAKLKSVYAIRIYTTLKAIRSKRQKHGKVSRETWKVKELKELIGASEQYERFYNLRKRAIEPAFKEINAKTDIIIIDINYIKAGRTIKKIEFVFTDQGKATKEESTSKVLSQPLKSQTPQKKNAQVNTREKYKKQIEALTLAQYFAFEFLRDETRDVNIKIILEDILPSIAKMGEVPRGFEDIYIESVWTYVKKKSKTKNPKSWAAIFISWWRNPESLNNDKNVAIFFDAVHDFKRSIKNTKQDINRRKAQGLPVREAQLILGLIKNKTAELKNKTTSIVEKPSTKRTRGTSVNIGKIINDEY